MHHVCGINPTGSVRSAQKHNEKKAGITDLPDELIANITLKLPPKDQSKMACTCKTYRQISKTSFQEQKTKLKNFLERILGSELDLSSLVKDLVESEHFSLLKGIINRISRPHLHSALANHTLPGDLSSIELLHELLESPSPILHLSKEFCSKLPQETIHKLADLLLQKENLQRLFSPSRLPFGLFSTSRKLTIEAVKKYGENLQFASDLLKNDKQLVLTAVMKYGWALEYASESLKNDPDIVFAAVRQDPLALFYASPQLKNDRKIVLAAIDKDPLVLKFAPQLQNDQEIVLAAINKDGLALEYASDDLKNNPEIVLAAVSQNGEALAFADENLLQIPAISLAAVKQNGFVLEMLPEELQNNFEVVKAAVKQNGRSLQFASSVLKNTFEIVKAAVEQNGESLWFASLELKNDPELQAIAKNKVR